MIEDHTTDRDAARRLAPRVFLHLPRLADRRGWVGHDAARREIERIAAAEPIAPQWLRTPNRIPNSPLELSLTEIETERAHTLHNRFHYLRSYRPGLHLAGTFEGHVATLLSFSDLDLDAIRRALPLDRRILSAQVLSRVYSASWAPRNALSRMLALATRNLRERDPRLGLVLTYVNPGVGFDGASYKAANWRLFGCEHGTRYGYLDADYITDRELSQRFGTSHAAALERILSDRIGFSRMSLPPLDLYVLALDSRLRAKLRNTKPSAWLRPWA